MVLLNRGYYNYLIFMYFHLAPPFLGFLLISLVFSIFFSLISVFFCVLQCLVITFIYRIYNATFIWTMRLSWRLDAWRILNNHIKSWFSWSRRIIDPLIFKNKSFIELKLSLMRIPLEKEISVWKGNWFYFRKCPV